MQIKKEITFKDSSIRRENVAAASAEDKSGISARWMQLTASIVTPGMPEDAIWKRKKDARVSHLIQAKRLSIEIERMSEQSDYTANLGDLIPIAYNAFLYTLYLVNRLRFSIGSDLYNQARQFLSERS